MTTGTTRTIRIIRAQPLADSLWRHALPYLLGLLVVLGARQLAGREITMPVGNAPTDARNTRAEAPRSGNASGTAPAAETVRLREGTRLTDELGEFQKSGERYNFHPQGGKGPIRVLENLALERVASLLGGEVTPRLWSVSGVVTEYCGENFLLVTRAVMKPRRSPPPPAETAAKPATSKAATP